MIKIKFDIAKDNIDMLYDFTYMPLQLCFILYI